MNGRSALAQAPLTADIIGLILLGKTLPDGNAHAVCREPDRLDATVALIADFAGERAGAVELNALVRAVVVTDDRRRAAEERTAKTPGLEVGHGLSTPFFALGTRDQIAEHLLACPGSVGDLLLRGMRHGGLRSGVRRARPGGPIVVTRLARIEQVNDDRLTDKGHDACTVPAALDAWGRRWPAARRVCL